MFKEDQHLNIQIALALPVSTIIIRLTTVNNMQSVVQLSLLSCLSCHAMYAGIVTEISAGRDASLPSCYDP